jgi:hypothetical protein
MPHTIHGIQFNGNSASASLTGVTSDGAEKITLMVPDLKFTPGTLLRLNWNNLLVLGV